jgi:hypothetical protein
MPTAMAWVKKNGVRLMAMVVFTISLIVFARITPRFVRTMAYPTGDEPYYLLIAHSLVHDRDIELTNNYDNKDYWHYYPGELYPRHEAKTTAPGLYSKHAPGVSLLIAPAYILGDWQRHVQAQLDPSIQSSLPTYATGDWQATVYFYNILGALLAANIYLLAYEIARKQWVALLLWLTLSFTNPLMSYTFLIFPALVSALMTVYAFRRIRLDGIVAPLSGNGPVRMFLIGFCLGFMPWLHARFLPVSFSLFLYLLWREAAARRAARKQSMVAAPGEQAGQASSPPLAAPLPTPQPLARGRSLVARLVAFAVPSVIAAVSLLAYFKILYGTYLPNYGDHAGMGGPDEWVVAFFGSFLDQQWGLFIHAPVLILTIVGIMWMLKQHKMGDVFWLAVIAIPYAMIIITYKQWWGEWCPPARYWVSLIPLCVVPLANVLAGPIKRGFAALYMFLAAISWAIMAIFMYEPHLMYNHPVGSSRLLEWIAGSQLLQPLLPTYFRVEWSNVWLTILYTELVMFIVWLGWKQIKQGKTNS